MATSKAQNIERLKEAIQNKNLPNLTKFLNPPSIEKSDIDYDTRSECLKLLYENIDSCECDKENTENAENCKNIPISKMLHFLLGGLTDQHHEFIMDLVLHLVQKACLDGIKELVKLNIDLSSKEIYPSFLEWATYDERSTSMIRILLEAGAPPSGVNCSNLDDGYFTDGPLVNTVMRNNYEQAKLLVEYGANVNNFRAEDGWYEFPLLWAVRQDTPEFDSKFIHLILDRDTASVNYQGEDHGDGITTCLMAAVGIDNIDVSVKVMRILFKNGADPDISLNKDENVLFLSYLKPAQLEVLIEYGIDVNRRNEEGRTAMVSHCGYGSTDIVRRLIQEGTDIEEISLEVALIAKHFVIVNMLLEAGYTQVQNGKLLSLALTENKDWAEVHHKFIETPRRLKLLCRDLLYWKMVKQAEKVKKVKKKEISEFFTNRLPTALINFIQFKELDQIQDKDVIDGKSVYNHKGVTICTKAPLTDCDGSDWRWLPSLF